MSHKQDPIHCYEERLNRAINALTDLYTEEGSINGIETEEMARLKAKKEGVQLALSYFLEETEWHYG